TTYAGTGTTGFGGDGGPATSAKVNRPLKMTVDSAGNLYFADNSNERIRRVDTSGVITTVGGPGGGIFDGDDGPLARASFMDPVAVAIDPTGRLLICDDEEVRVVDTTGIISTVAGHIDPHGMGPLAVAHFASPRALVVSAPRTIVAGGAT